MSLRGGCSSRRSNLSIIGDCHALRARNDRKFTHKNPRRGGPRVLLEQDKAFGVQTLFYHKEGGLPREVLLPDGRPLLYLPGRISRLGQEHGPPSLVCASSANPWTRRISGGDAVLQPEKLCTAFKKRERCEQAQHENRCCRYDCSDWSCCDTPRARSVIHC